MVVDEVLVLELVVDVVVVVDVVEVAVVVRDVIVVVVVVYASHPILVNAKLPSGSKSIGHNRVVVEVVVV